MRYTIAQYALVACAALSTSVNAHSWVERLISISSDGTFTGEPGYARGNLQRTDPKFAAGGDPLMVYQLPPLSQGVTITPQNEMCKDTQRQQVQTPGSPRLKAAAGSLVALQYQENGHVTLPENQPGKADPSRGTVYIYGTTQPKQDEKFLDVHKVWNADGTGGDKRGKMLAAMPYDDGRCYQVNPSKISTTRQGSYKFPFDKVTGNNLWCQNDIKIPTDAPDGKPYTLYWVWDWPTAAGVDPGLPKGKPEVYTTCMDIDISGQVQATTQGAYNAGAPPSGAAIPSYFEQLVKGKNVMIMDGGSGTPPPSTGSQSSAAAPAAPAPAQSKSADSHASMSMSSSCTTHSAPSAPPAPSAAFTTTVHDTVTVTTGSPTGASTPAGRASSSQTGAQAMPSAPSADSSPKMSSNPAASPPPASTATPFPAPVLPPGQMASPVPSKAPAAPPAAETPLPTFTVSVSRSASPAAASPPPSQKVSTIVAGPSSVPSPPKSVSSIPPAASQAPPAVKRRCFGAAARARRSILDSRSQGAKIHENKGGENLITPKSG